MPDAHRSFMARSRTAIGDEALHKALTNASMRFLHNRELAREDVPDWERLRDCARAIKAEALAHLDRYLIEFEAQAMRHGAMVHWAPAAADACRIVTGLALSHGVTRAVKSKSMVSEEIHLNDALARVGITATETDLGEFIVQLAGEAPSHILVPAVHKSRREIAALFTEKLGLEPDAEVETLTAAARARLRREFLTAGLGVSGANFAIAETGTLVIVENEGNARLSTSVPPLHIAIVGLEKIVPRVEDVATLLTLLPRNATGQPMTSYVSWITGPRRAQEADGPDELHIVLLDNGRTELLRDEEIRPALSCIRCGACLNACPVYRNIGGHAYGTVYAGPIGAIISSRLQPDAAAADLPFASTLCGACADVCPVRIDLPGLLLALRRQAADGRLPGAPLHERGRQAMAARIWAAVTRSPRLYRGAARLFRRWARGHVAGDIVPKLPGPGGGWTAVRDFPAPPRESFIEWWRHQGAGHTEQR